MYYCDYYLLDYYYYYYYYHLHQICLIYSQLLFTLFLLYAFHSIFGLHLHILQSILTFSSAAHFSLRNSF